MPAPVRAAADALEAKKRGGPFLSQGNRTGLSTITLIFFLEIPAMIGFTKWAKHDTV